jgi:cap1 methyltransferase
MFKNEFTIEEQSRIQLIIGDLGVQYDDSMRTTLSEQIYKYELTQTCRDALKFLSRHGHFICKISEMFTRFTIGLIYILYMSFEKITILKPFTLNPALPNRFIVCQNYLGCNNLYIEHLNCCLDRMKKLQNTENEIVQIVPMTCFKNSAFINYIREQTQSLTKRECEALKKLLWFSGTQNTANITDRIDGAAQRIKTCQRIVENIQ